jgi:cyclic beta-1,2-glucan synthetase
MSATRHMFRRRSWKSPWNSLAPIREELFSTERLEEHARSLAVAQTVTPKPSKGHPLTERLAGNGAILLGVYRSTAKVIEKGRAITPAAEWLIDNYHLVEQQIRQIRSDLVPGYYRQLPKLADGPFAGYPRVFGMTWAFVAHTDSHFDSEMLLHYVRAYQEVQSLTIGELWAVSITLRIVLIENLRRISEQIIHNHIARQEADDFADRLLGTSGRPAEPVPVVLAAHTDMNLADPFAVQLVHRLRDQDPRVTPALTWLDDCLAARQTTADAVVSEVHKQQGASNVTVRNIITSLRLISDVDWKDLFEQLCLVDTILAAGRAFQEMDFSTRNLYRSAIEELARGANRTELDVAQQAIAATQRAAVSGTAQADARRRDPGYYLVAGGLYRQGHL